MKAEEIIRLVVYVHLCILKSGAISDLFLFVGGGFPVYSGFPQNVQLTTHDLIVM